MRTTLDIADDVLLAAREQARSRLGDVCHDRGGLRQASSNPAALGAAPAATGCRC